MGALTPFKIIITEGAIANVLQSLLKRYREGRRSRPILMLPGSAGPGLEGAAGPEPRCPTALAGRLSSAESSGAQPKKPREDTQQVRPCPPRMSPGGALDVRV